VTAHLCRLTEGFSRPGKAFGPFLVAIVGEFFRGGTQLPGTEPPERGEPSRQSPQQPASRQAPRRRASPTEAAPPGQAQPAERRASRARERRERPAPRGTNRKAARPARGAPAARPPAAQATEKREAKKGRLEQTANSGGGNQDRDQDNHASRGAFLRAGWRCAGRRSVRLDRCASTRCATRLGLI
jgi:hypothetical protein